MNTSIRISTILATIGAAATLSTGPGTAPAQAGLAADRPDSCCPATSTAQADFIDRIIVRKEQMSRDRAHFGW